MEALQIPGNFVPLAFAQLTDLTFHTMFLSDLSALAMRKKIKSELNFLVFRSVSYSFCKHAVGLLLTLYLHIQTQEKKPTGTALP